MPKLSRIKCPECGRKFTAPRSDSKWCSEKCRYKYRAFEAKFGDKKRSGVPGITWCRINHTWQIRIKEDRNWKYVGTAKELNAAIKFRNEVVG